MSQWRVRRAARSSYLTAFGATLENLSTTCAATMGTFTEH